MKRELMDDRNTNRAGSNSIPNPISGSLCRREFKELLREVVDESLSILGDSAKQAIYFSLEREYEIEKEEIPDKIEGFTNAIEEIFGMGAKLLQIQIMKRLYQTIGLDFEYFPEKGELLFVEYVTAIGDAYTKGPTRRLPAPSYMQPPEMPTF
ncbi:MAG: hypothetical protein JSW53_02445 [Candidatus Bathyarchaeota archaeon]|nr:MAG: hypothetical protein JSW53_02445 [Candidatus Bathyarchaeota archaeon]